MNGFTFFAGMVSGTMAGMVLFDLAPVLVLPDNLVIICFSGLGLGILLLVRAMR